MNFVHRFFGESAATTQGDASRFSFAPDALRPPTFFSGRIADKIAFREAISALHHVVVSDQRYRAPDKTAYLEWLAGQDEALLAGATAGRAGIEAKIAPLREKIFGLNSRISRLSQPWREAQARYFKWLYDNDRTAWIVLDPVVSVHPDEISFECFSLDESTYARLACDYDAFESLGERQYGVTNVDYSRALYDEFQKIRSWRETVLTIDPSGFEATSEDSGWREEKIDLPDSWTRGFLQVSCAMALPAAEFSLQPMDMANILARLQARREQAGPRALRFRLTPGAPVAVVLEPWGEVLEFPRSIHDGAQACEIRVWGRRRLALLARALPFARTIRVRLAGSGLPSFFTVDFGGLRLTLGLSGWTANDWAGAGRFDLLAPSPGAGAQDGARVFDALARDWVAREDDLARATGLARPVVAASLTALAQAGRALYDVDKGVWRRRELTAGPLDPQSLRFLNAEEANADRFINAGLTRIDGLTRGENGRREIAARTTDDGRTFACRIVVDGDDRLADGLCECEWFARHKLTRGPCAHMLAARRLARRADATPDAPLFGGRA